MKKIVCILTLLHFIFIGIHINAQNNGKGENEDNKFWDSINRHNYNFKFTPYFKLSELFGQVYTNREGYIHTYIKNVTVTVRESNKPTIIEKCVTDSFGMFFLKKLDYDKNYTITFSKEGYYERFIWVYTFDVPDSLKEVKFKYHSPVIVNLKEEVNGVTNNPFTVSQALIKYETIEIQNISDVWTDKNLYERVDRTGKRDSLFIKKGGIVYNLNYYKQNKYNEETIEGRLSSESDKKSKKQITDFQMKIKVQQLEQEKIKQEKLFLTQSNKLIESEIAKEKALASSKEKELIMVQQKQRMKSLEEEQKEIQHKTELRQRLIIIYSIATGLLFVLVFAGFIFRSLRVTNKQKTIIEVKNKEITDSISYALRIQTAILPPQKIVKQYLENSFILYKPKDIVAGDFYWMETVNDIVLFAACDCTGHGVPGAMVSVVCHNALNRAVREFGLTQPSDILDKTAEIVIENFSKSEESIKDGMDISLCSLNLVTRKLQWAGANNPIWLLQNRELLETKANKQPIGMNEDSKPFTNHTFNLQKGETIYLFTDGFADQFGGETGQKKLTKKRFKDLILSVQNKTLQEQGISLDKYITEYRKEVEQIDDILVMGVRV